VFTAAKASAAAHPIGIVVLVGVAVRYVVEE
jgi:hypothetical protein